VKRKYVCNGDEAISASNRTHHCQYGSKRVGLDVIATWACSRRAIVLLASACCHSVLAIVARNV